MGQTREEPRALAERLVRLADYPTDTRTGCSICGRQLDAGLRVGPGDG